MRGESGPVGSRGSYAREQALRRACAAGALRRAWQPACLQAEASWADAEESYVEAKGSTHPVDDPSSRRRALPPQAPGILKVASESYSALAGSVQPPRLHEASGMVWWEK